MHGGEGGEAAPGHALRRAGGRGRARSRRCARRGRACWPWRRAHAAARPRGLPRRRPTRRASRSSGSSGRADDARAAPIRVAVVGVGALGQHHARVYAALPGAALAGRLRHRPRRAPREVAARHGCRAFATSRDLLAGGRRGRRSPCPPSTTTAWPAPLLEAGKDVLVEKPITHDPGRGRRPDRARRASGAAILQVGPHRALQPRGRRPARERRAARASSRSTGWARSRPAASTSTSSST